MLFSWSSPQIFWGSHPGCCHCVVSPDRATSSAPGPSAPSERASQHRAPEHQPLSPAEKAPSLSLFPGRRWPERTCVHTLWSTAALATRGRAALRSSAGTGPRAPVSPHALSATPSRRRDQPGTGGDATHFSPTERVLPIGLACARRPARSGCPNLRHLARAPALRPCSPRQARAWRRAESSASAATVASAASAAPCTGTWSVSRRIRRRGWWSTCPTPMVVKQRVFVPVIFGSARRCHPRQCLQHAAQSSAAILGKL